LNSIRFGWRLVAYLGVGLLAAASGGGAAEPNPAAADVVIVGGTPGGIMAAIAAARAGHSVLLLERTGHPGGLVANGLGATDIGTRGATGGLFLEFIRGVRRHYVETYGAQSQQVLDCHDGYHFEPSVGERILDAMLAAQPRITVLRQRQFEALPVNVKLAGGRLAGIRILDRQKNVSEWIEGQIFVDATYEGDLAAAAGVAYRVGREGRGEFGEPMAGQIYKTWGGPVEPDSSGLGDNAVQSYNYRLTLTRDPKNRVAIPMPANYRRDEYAALADDVRTGRQTAGPGARRPELDWADGLGRAVNMVVLPNGKVDANNQHASFLSTDLPEENWPWPTSLWDWRDRFAQRQRDYTLGLIWFCQNDPELPASFRAHCAEWGLAADEYPDNGHFPRQIYVREGRRIVGEYTFSAKDATPVITGGRPPIHADSITASHYSLDSHPAHKREAGRTNLEGMFSFPTAPYTVPYGVMVPRGVDGLLVPVAASSTHVGFATLRMEPCWMALGEAAGEAANLALERKTPLRQVEIAALQRNLLQHGAILFYFRDVDPSHRDFPAIERMGLRGLIPGWTARPDDPVTAAEARAWCWAAGVDPVLSIGPAESRGDFLAELDRKIGPP